MEKEPGEAGRASMQVWSHPKGQEKERKSAEGSILDRYAKPFSKATRESPVRGVLCLPEMGLPEYFFCTQPLARGSPRDMWPLHRHDDGFQSTAAETLDPLCFLHPEIWGVCSHGHHSIHYPSFDYSPDCFKKSVPFLLSLNRTQGWDNENITVPWLHL